MGKALGKLAREKGLVAQKEKADSEDEAS